MHAFFFVYARLLLPVSECISLQPSVHVCTLAAVLSLYYPRLFSNLVRLNMHCLLCPTSWNVSAATQTPLGKYRLFSPPLRPHFGESNLLLAEMFATIRVSPVVGVMLLKGSAWLLEVGLEKTHWDVVCAILAWDRKGWQSARKSVLLSFYCTFIRSWFTWAELFVSSEWIFYKNGAGNILLAVFILLS